MTDPIDQQPVNEGEKEPTIEEKRQDLHALVDTVEEDDLLVVFLGKHTDEGVEGSLRISADPEGIGQVMEQLAIRLGFMISGNPKATAQEAYCVGVGAFGGVAKRRMQDYADQAAADRKAAGKHVVEDVTEGAAANDQGRKGTH